MKTGPTSSYGPGFAPVSRAHLRSGVRHQRHLLAWADPAQAAAQRRAALGIGQQHGDITSIVRAAQVGEHRRSDRAHFEASAQRSQRCHNPRIKAGNGHCWRDHDDRLRPVRSEVA
ncbi:MAG TPA: hypothetical protein VMA72_04840 [Streptosporangiaceae bacterium]|nr:hypothetical protein [Streptosporangiaceae bacterium]